MRPGVCGLPISERRDRKCGIKLQDWPLARVEVSARLYLITDTSHVPSLPHANACHCHCHCAHLPDFGWLLVFYRQTIYLKCAPSGHLVQQIEPQMLRKRTWTTTTPLLVLTWPDHASATIYLIVVSTIDDEQQSSQFFARAVLPISSFHPISTGINNNSHRSWSLSKQKPSFLQHFPIKKPSPTFYFGTSGSITSYDFLNSATVFDISTTWN